MASGKFRHPVTVQSYGNARDEYGAPTRVWINLFDTWAEIKPIRSSEFFAAGAVNSRVTHRVVVRYDSRIEPNMRLIHQGRVFEIEGPPRDYRERHGYVELMCREVFDGQDA